MFDLTSVFGAEDIGGGAAPETVEGAVYQEAVQDAAISEVEKDMAQVEAQVEATETQMDQVEDRVDEIEEDLAELKDMVDGNEAWNPGLAKHIYTRLVKKSNAFVVPGFDALELQGQEAFGERQDAQIALVSGMEAIGEKMKKVGGAIKTFFVNLYNGFIAWFTGLFNKYKGIEKKAQNMKTRIQGTADDKIKKEIKLGGWNRYLNIDKRKTDAGNELNIQADAVKQVCEDMISALKEGGASPTNLAQRFAEKLNAYLTKAADDKSSGEGNENTTTVKGKIGGIQVVAVVPKTDAKNKGAALKAANITFKATGEGSKTDGTIASSANKSLLTKWCDSVISNAKKLQLDKFSNKALETQRDQAVAVASQMETGGDEDKAKEKKENIAIIHGGHTAALKISKNVQSFAGDQLLATLGYVNAHL